MQISLRFSSRIEVESSPIPTIAVGFLTVDIRDSFPDKINPSRVSNGSQFFICLEPAPSYDGQSTVFGHVIYGYETLDAISTAPVDSNDYPLERSIIRSVKILPREQLPPEPAPPVPGKKPAKRWWQIFG